ncbi:hypothetical protein BP354E_1128 [Burkholderia pseudomallei 354e]|nr:hypothetical protein BPC006_I2156 [Burkholderia pseudomallei BPC006]EIF77065.1 hypothetical protein BP354E_1128 [Burkholderia pseudomallei 354e]
MLANPVACDGAPAAPRGPSPVVIRLYGAARATVE